MTYYNPDIERAFKELELSDRGPIRPEGMNFEEFVREGAELLITECPELFEMLRNI